MIFVTVGTTPFPFYRMVDVVKGLIKSRKKDEAIIFQHGNIRCDIKEKNVILYRYLPFSKMEYYIKQARIIVTHGGPATIYQVLAAGKIPHVLPREKKYGEHVNNHQVVFLDFMEKSGLVNPINSTRDVVRKPLIKPVLPITTSRNLVAYLTNITKCI